MGRHTPTRSCSLIHLQKLPAKLSFGTGPEAKPCSHNSADERAAGEAALAVQGVGRWDTWMAADNPPPEDTERCSQAGAGLDPMIQRWAERLELAEVTRLLPVTKLGLREASLVLKGTWQSLISPSQQCVLGD